MRRGGRVKPYELFKNGCCVITKQHSGESYPKNQLLVTFDDFFWWMRGGDSWFGSENFLLATRLSVWVKIWHHLKWFLLTLKITFFMNGPKNQIHNEKIGFLIKNFWHFLLLCFAAFLFDGFWYDSFETFLIFVVFFSVCLVDH